MDIVFVVLHYMAMKETKMCVDYLKNNIDTRQYHIIIVDNASTDNSGKLLQEEYKEDNDITVLINQENLGFARGNNVGFRYAKEKWNPTYIVLMNNDVFLVETELKAKLDKEFQLSKFHVLGPMIMTGDGRCDVNPQEPEFKNIDELEKRIEGYRKELRRYELHYSYVYNKLMTVKKILLPGKRKKKTKKDYIKRVENVKLHGCFWVFSQQYISKYDGLDESTFLFWEEEFLYKHMISNGGKMVYNPDIRVYHMEDASTNDAITNAREKMIFIRTHYVESLNALLKVYRFYEDKKENSQG